MSFDLFVFEPRRNVSLPEAVDLYRGLGGNARAEAVANLVAGPRIDAFYEALTKLFPEIGDSDDDASPFACAIERAAGAIVLAIVFSRADEVQAVVERLAAEHGLYVLDPQSTKLFAPSDTPRSAIPRKLSRRDGVARFADVVRPALEAMGFASVKKKKDRWRRACAGGTFLELGLDLSLNDARPDVALGHEDVVRAYQAAVGARELAPTMGLEHLYFGGLIPGRAWDPRYEGTFLYELCHPECIAASSATFLDEVQRFAVPLGEALGSLSALDEFFTRKERFGVARAKWGIDREKVSGPAGRFWRWDRGLVFVTAVGAIARPSERSACLQAARERMERWAEKKVSGATPTLAAELAALGRAVDA